MIYYLSLNAVIFYYLLLFTIGWIDLYEFVGYMIKRSNAAKSRIHSMKHDSIFAVATNPGVCFVNHGWCLCVFIIVLGVYSL